MPIAINGSGTITGISAGGLPDATITQAELASGVAGNGPAFRAYASGNLSLTSTVFTKVPISLESFDTANCFDTSTYRFTPNVAGYYNVLFNGYFSAGTFSSPAYALIYKNGAAVTYGSMAPSPGVSSGADVVYLNGTTDYIELYVAGYGTGVTLTGSGSTLTYMSAALVRAA